MRTALEPLAGTRVLDFTAFPPGAACALVLADLGAEVIRIEPPAQKGKPSLVIGQVALSRGKRSICIDLRHPAAGALLRRLAGHADVILESAKPGSMEERGFGYRHAREANPRIIWCALTGFGQGGPNANHAGHDLSYLAHSGLLGALSSDPSWQPGLPLALQAGGLCAAIGIQGALLERSRSGEGGFVDISLSEAATWFLSCGIRALSDHPFRLSSTPDRRLYACADGRFVAVACSEPRTWGVLCDQLGAPELKTNLHKTEAAEETAMALAALFARRPAAEWAARLAPAGAAVTVMNHAGQLLDDPHIRARHSVAEVAGVPVPASPVRIRAPDGRETATALGEPHRVGADNEAVLAAAGLSADEIAALTDQGVI